MKNKKIIQHLKKFISSDFFEYKFGDLWRLLLTVLFSINFVLAFSFIREAKTNSNSSFEIIVAFFLLSISLYILYKIHSNWDTNCYQFSAFLFAVGSFVMVMVTNGSAGFYLCHFSMWLYIFGLVCSIISSTFFEKKRKKK